MTQIPLHPPWIHGGRCRHYVFEFARLRGFLAAADGGFCGRWMIFTVWWRPSASAFMASEVFIDLN
jgi:hypothetical protein